MRLRLSAVGLCLAGLLWPFLASAQESSRLDLEGGVGYSIGRGAEDPAPSLRTWSGSGTVWVTRRWGLAVGRVVSTGEDLFDIPPDSVPRGDREFLGQDDLRYTRVTVRHRRERGAWTWIGGAGIVLGAAFDDIARLHANGQRVDMRTRWGGLSLEALADRRLTSHLSLRAGVSLDTNTETTVLHPVLLGVIRF